MEKNKKKGKVIALFTLIAVLAVALVVGIILLLKKKNQIYEVKLEDYVVAESVGYDGFGTVEWYFDSDKFIADYAEKVKLSEKGEKHIKNDLEEYFEEEFMVPRSATYGANLSNGDSITIDFNIDDKFKKYFENLKLDSKKMKYTVEGLKAVEKQDVFELIDVKFSGTEPDGTAYIEKKANADISLPQKYFELDKYSGLSEGDSITVTFTMSADECFGEFGFLPEKYEKTYTVPALAHYVTDISEISEEAMNTMVEQGKDVTTSSTAEWPKGSTINSLEYAGNYLLYSKYGNSDYENILYIVYKINATVAPYYSSAEYQTIDYYYVISYRDILVNSDGSNEVEFSNYLYTSKNFYADKAEKRVYGYLQITDLEQDLIVGKVDEYYYTTSMQ